MTRTVESAPALGVTTLTLYAFSSDNWRQPRAEVSHLMRLFQRHLDTECDRLAQQGVQLSIIGRRDRLPPTLTQRIACVEERTRHGQRLHLRIALDYSARDALMSAAAAYAQAYAHDVAHTLARSADTTREALTRPNFQQFLAQAMHAPDGASDVDLLIRTGGEQRLSDFLLWESAYAELFFTDVLWPDFQTADLQHAVQSFGARDRRFGGLTPAAQRAAHSTPSTHRALRAVR